MTFEADLSRHYSGVRQRLHGVRPAAHIEVLPPAPPAPKSPWLPAEDDIIRRHSQEGSKVLLGMLPGRTRLAIIQRARIIGHRVRRVSGFGHSQPSRRGKIAIHPNSHRLIRRFFVEANAQRKTYRELNSGTGLGDGTVQGWHRSMPHIDTLEAALNYLGLTLTITRMPARQSRS